MVIPAFFMDNEAYEIERLTHEQVRVYIEERPAVVVPLGGCEPLGAIGMMGAESVCVSEIAKEVSRRCRILTAPLVPFGCSTPFMSFPGASGVKPRTFINMLCDILHAYVFQGVGRIIIISAAPFNREPAEEVLKRIVSRYPKVRIVFFDINSMLGGQNNGIDRNDALLLSLFMYLRPDVSIHQNWTGRQNWIDQYRVWKKRGRDPEKLKKLCQDGLLMMEDGEISQELGRDYFERIVGMICSDAERI
jgi:creatinine amidohydrolase/Fe(II)-dependent formamide hydrolase-like protein